MKKSVVLFLLTAFGLSAHAAADTSKVVPVQGATNFRQLGGYATQQGTHVKSGKLFRSGELSKLTDADVKLLADQHINHIVDFRNDQEVATAKDRLPAGAAYLQLPAGSENLGNFMSTLPKLTTGDSLMTSFYSQTSHLKAKYQPFFQELLKTPDNSALLFHCTAGKDRTGIGAAMLLYVLGVPGETIMTDYLASNDYRKAENEKMVAGMTKMGIKEQVAKDITGVKEIYLQATYMAIVKQYSSMDNFISKELGLTAADIALLRKKYTE